jgi:two-component system sensor histidine kinase PhcS
MPEDPIHSQEMRKAFAEYDRRAILNNVKVGCLIGVVLMPVGIVLDFFVYRNDLVFFLKLRLLCSLLIAAFWLVVISPFGHKHPRALGVLLAMFPSFFMSWMIYAAEPNGGSESPYYAGLNLVLLVIGFVLYWTVAESLVAVSAVMLMYVVACVWHGGISQVAFVNNLYFLVLTGVIVITGSYVHTRWRFREFVLRFQLDASRKQLEENNLQLDRQNSELADTLQKLTEAESQLVQSEKMASLGVMSAGIIHEINNPLNYATTGLYSLRQKGKHLAPEQQADFADILKDVEEGVSRVKNIVSDLRMFTHPSTDGHDQVEVAEVVEPSLRFLSNELKDKVCIERQWPEHQTVTANKQKLIHVCTNLLHNSLDALKTKTFTDEKPTIWIEGRAENGRSLLTIRDNGPGIEAQHLNKIFDPFFTTKDVGEGMGLGLSICYRIMHESGGRISVRTEPGKFCEFTLEFPAKG